jgi:hypothetical protein
LGSGLGNFTQGVLAIGDHHTDGHRGQGGGRDEPGRNDVLGFVAIVGVIAAAIWFKGDK